MYFVAKLFFDITKIANRRESFPAFLDNDDNKNFDATSKTLITKKKST